MRTPLRALAAALTAATAQSLIADGRGWDNKDRTSFYKKLTEAELLALGQAMARAGHGVFELTSDLLPEWDEFGWMRRLSDETGQPILDADFEPIPRNPPGRLFAWINGQSNPLALLAS